MFEAFINRTLAYRIKSHIGLITFSNEPRVQEDITSVVEDFRSSLKHVNCNGETALWDALALAKEKIMVYADRYPDAKRRIVCLTDGRDTHSTNKPLDLSENLQVAIFTFFYSNLVGYRAQILLSIHSSSAKKPTQIYDIYQPGIVLSFPSSKNRTGGYKFNPEDIESAMGICELETVLNSLERPDEAVSFQEDVFLRGQPSLQFFANLRPGRRVVTFKVPN